MLLSERLQSGLLSNMLSEVLTVYEHPSTFKSLYGNDAYNTAMQINDLLRTNFPEQDYLSIYVCGDISKVKVKEILYNVYIKIPKRLKDKVLKLLDDNGVTRHQATPNLAGSDKDAVKYWVKIM